MKSNVSLTMPGEADQAQAHSCGCGCGADQTPQLRVADLPKQIRHGAIIGGLLSLGQGGQLVLVANHNPLPLLKQLEERAPGAFGVEYLAEGPEWQLEFTRR